VIDGIVAMRNRTVINNNVYQSIMDDNIDKLIAYRDTQSVISVFKKEEDKEQHQKHY
jgi:hypothetical protein